MEETLEEQIEEFDNLMQAGLDEAATGDYDLAEEYFSDAAHVLQKVQNTDIKKQLELKYSVNPLDFAQ